MKQTLFSLLLFITVTFTAVLAIPIEKRGSDTSLCPKDVFRSALKTSNYRQTLKDSFSGGLIRRLQNGPFEWLEGKPMKEYLDSLVSTPSWVTTSDIEADHVVEAQYVKYLIKKVILKEGGLDQFCGYNNAERKAVFKEVKKSINGKENLRWLHREANNAKLQVFGDLIRPSEPNQPLPDYGTAGDTKSSFTADRQLLVGVSEYMENTFNSYIEISRSVYRAFEASKDPAIQAMRAELSEDQLIERVYDDISRLSTHVQDRAQFQNPTTFKRWDLPTVEDVKVGLGQLCPRSGPLGRRCLQSANDVGSNGIPWAAAAAAIAAGGDSSSSQPQPLSTQVVPPTSEPAQTSSISSTSAIPSSSSPPLSSSSSIPPTSTSPASSSSSTPPPPPVTSTSSSLAPTSIFTPITASFVGPINLSSLVSSVSAGFTPPPTSAPAPTSTLFPLGTNTLPTYTDLGDLGINTIHLAGGGSLHEQ